MWSRRSWCTYARQRSLSQLEHSVVREEHVIGGRSGHRSRENRHCFHCLCSCGIQKCSYAVCMYQNGRGSGLSSTVRVFRCTSLKFVHKSLTQIILFLRNKHAYLLPTQTNFLIKGRNSNPTTQAFLNFPLFFQDMIWIAKKVYFFQFLT